MNSELLLSDLVAKRNRLLEEMDHQVLIYDHSEDGSTQKADAKHNIVLLNGEILEIERKMDKLTDEY